MRSLNHLLVLLTCAASLWAWVSLPELDIYPIHWNIHGEADGFSSKWGVLLVLFILPITAIFTHALMWVLTKTESVKAAMEKSSLVYDITWHSCLWLYLVINIILAGLYMTLLEGPPASFDNDLLIRVLPVMSGVFFIVIGNVMAKAKQNLFVGVRTPWTLKSKSTWDATHRMSGRLWVGGGLVMMLVPFVLSGASAITAFIALVLIISFVPIIYSYVYYRSASDKPE